MKIILSWLLVLCLTAGAGALAASDQQKVRVAVLDLQPKNATSELAQALTDLIRVELIKQGVFDMLDRENIKAILKEQAFQQSGCTSTDCAVEIGQMLNCQQMFIGSLSQIGGRYFLSVQRVNVETGKAEFAESVEAKTERDLPDVAVELAEKMAGGKMGQARSFGKLSGMNRRFLFEVSYAGMFGQGVNDGINPHDADADPNPDDTSAVHSLGISKMGFSAGVRFYSRRVPWLGIGFQFMELGGTDDESDIQSTLIREEIAGNQSINVYGGSGLDKLRLYGGRVYFDVGRKLDFSPRQAQLILGAGLTNTAYYEWYGLSHMGTDGTVIYEHPGLNVDSSKDGHSDSSYVSLGAELRNRWFQLSAGVIMLSDLVIFDKPLTIDGLRPDYDKYLSPDEQRVVLQWDNQDCFYVSAGMVF